ncbi:MAG TPA: polyprenyl synthetase family protein [Acetobacteraceae bacterium]|nr:polyprenyl synthetase family protein [Acetobacteraceae bacterium]
MLFALDPAGADAPLVTLAALLRDDAVACGRMIDAQADSKVELIPRVASHILAAGGKRLRPLLTLAAARLCDAAHSDAPHIALSACIELIHTATLLHDDVVDASARRRGRASANALFGSKAPVLVGDFLFARAFQLMVESDSLRVLRIMADATATIVSGELLQLDTQNDMATTDEQYFAVVTGKTAALFAAACEIGAIAAGCEDACPALADYGANLGISFQLVDDALDYAADEANLGKSIGDDFREGKVTLPALIAYRRGAPWERCFWERAIGRAEQHDGDLEQAISLLRAHDAIAATLAQANAFADCACDALTAFPDTPLRRCLSDVARFAVTRTC